MTEHAPGSARDRFPRSGIRQTHRSGDPTEIHPLDAQIGAGSRPAYENLVYRISALAVEVRDTNRFQSECLALLGREMAVSRAYIFRHRRDTDTMDNTHEWCASGVEPQKEHLQGVPGHAVPWWTDTLRQGEIINFSDVEKIPDAGAREMLRPQGILSILAVPLFVGDRYSGFIGFDDCAHHRSWPGEDVEILRTISRILASVLERKEAEDRLQAERSQLQAERSQLLSIFDSIDEPIYVSDPGSYEVLFVNKAMRELLGGDPLGGLCHQEFYGFEEPCSFCTNHIILENRNETYRWEQENALLGGTFALHDRIIRWPDGRDVRLELAFDITQQKRLEEQLQASQKMEAVGQLAGGVAHDFNNLLSVVVNYANFVLDGLHESDPLRKDVLEIRKAGDRAVSLTRQLLAFSRKQVLEPQVLDLNKTVAEMEPMLKRLIGEDVELVRTLATGLGKVKADPGQVEQVIMNLVVNARDAMPTGGRLTMETANVELDAGYARENPVITPGAYVLLAISDTGCGMDEEVRKRLFEPFFTTKELGKGTGLGLSTVYGIVKQSGGYIWVSSEPDQGSTFKVYLPRLMDETAPATVPKEEEEVLAGTETILVVEDEDAVREVAARMLRSAGYRVLTASNGSEALSSCEGHPEKIHLLLTDVVMPGMSGRQLAKRMREVRPELQILYMSGYLPSAIGHHGVLEPGEVFLHKPFNGKELRRKVRRALGTRQNGG